MTKQKFYPSKPLIRNAIHPDDLFTKKEIEMLKDCAERVQRERIGKKAKSVSEQEKKTVAHLLEQARFNGFYMNCIDEHGHLIWGCLLINPIRKTPQVIVSIMSCDKCSANFHSAHYDDEEPTRACDDCQVKVRNPKIPFCLKGIPQLRNRPEAGTELKIVELREEKEKIEEENSLVVF